MFNFEHYLKRQREEEIKELRKLEAGKSGSEGEGYDEEEASGEEADEQIEYGSEEEVKPTAITPQLTTTGGKKKKIKGGAFAVNTSYCKSELELLQHVIYKNSF